MFGSVSVVSDKKEKKEKKGKKDKKSRKKEKKDKRKKDRKRKRSASSSSSGSSSSRSRVGGNDDRAQREKEDDELFAALFGATSGDVRVTKGDKYMDELHAGRKGPVTRDTTDMFAAGLKGRFAAPTVATNELAGQNVAMAAAAPGARAAQPIASVIDGDGKYNGMFVPEHLRDLTIGDFEALLRKGQSQQHSRKRAKKSEGGDRFTPYEGIEKLMDLVKAEKAEFGQAAKAADIRAAADDEGSPIVYGTRRFQKENLVAMGNHVMMLLPVFAPVVAGQVYLTPLQPKLSETEFDEEEIEEIRNFKKCLIQMAQADGCQMVFVEVAKEFGNRRQTYIDCIPIPDETFDRIEIVMYSALKEAGNHFNLSHKKVIPIKDSKKRLSTVVPPGVPYCNVSFNLDGGFAFVIPENSSFSRYWGVNVCGDVLGVGMGAGRLSKTERAKLLGADARSRFRKRWEPFDWTKMLDQQEDGVSDDDEAPPAAPVTAQPDDAPAPPDVD